MQSTVEEQPGENMKTEVSWRIEQEMNKEQTGCVSSANEGQISVVGVPRILKKEMIAHTDRHTKTETKRVNEKIRERLT